MDLIINFAGALVGLIFTAWIFSLFFQVNKQIALKKIQIKLLYRMAEQSGIEKRELNSIVRNDGDLMAFTG